jgi:hypothetical protein
LTQLLFNRHQRSLKIYFQDTLTAEKVAEFGRQFNNTPKLSFRKVEVMRSVVMELDCDSLRPSLYVVERYLEDDAPFQKFNNNGEQTWIHPCRAVDFALVCFIGGGCLTSSTHGHKSLPRLSLFYPTPVLLQCTEPVK